MPQIVNQYDPERINENDAGFNMLEACISLALLIFALTMAINVMIGMAKGRHAVAAKAAASSALDNFLASLRASSGYDSNLREILIDGKFPATFTLASDVKDTHFDCTSTPNQTGLELIVFTCKRNDGELARRVFVIPAVAPAPGAVLTPAPSDIIRLHVSTENVLPGIR